MNRLFVKKERVQAEDFASIWRDELNKNFHIFQIWQHRVLQPAIDTNFIRFSRVFPTVILTCNMLIPKTLLWCEVIEEHEIEHVKCVDDTGSLYMIPRCLFVELYENKEVF